MYIGIDVQIRRGVTMAIMETDGVVTETRWLAPTAAPRRLSAYIRERNLDDCRVGIDAPRQPLRVLRRWTYRQKGWQRDTGRIGRHCEVVVRTLGLGNPQWTPLRKDAPEWMRLGFALFRAAEKAGAVVHEVFPSVTYQQLNEAGDTPPVTMPLTNLAAGPKDMLDAVAAAYTVWRLHVGEGMEVGGGDGLGTIVLPRSEHDHPVMTWPG